MQLTEQSQAAVGSSALFRGILCHQGGLCAVNILLRLQAFSTSWFPVGYSARGLIETLLNGDAEGCMSLSTFYRL